MGWCSATSYFDDVVEAAKEVLEEISEKYSDQIPKHAMLVKIVYPLARDLEEGDWDCQMESDYWDELKWDVFPELAKRHEEEMEEDRRLYGD